MSRRFVTLILFALLYALCVQAEAQQQSKLPTIGFLSVGVEPSNMSEAFVGGLRELGYVENRNIAIEYRHSHGKFAQLPQLATELVRLKVDVIFARGLQAAKVARDATATIPIVMVGTDPVRGGLVASLARPGGNITGVDLTWQELSKNYFELL